VDKDEVISHLVTTLSGEDFKHLSSYSQAQILYDLIGDCGFIDTKTDDDMFVDTGEPIENEDGSATIDVTMDYETLKLYASIGVFRTLEDAIKKTLDEQVIA
jgi:hypothetical protein